MTNRVYSPAMKMLGATILAAALLTPMAAAHADVRTNPAAHAGETPGTHDADHYLGRVTQWRPRVFVVGDSITRSVYLHHGFTGLGWEVSAAAGREVQTLPYYIHDRRANRKAKLRTVVVALGTNASQGWTRADYAQTVRSLPRKTRVVFVTTYRDPDLWPETNDFKTRARIQGRYSEWMREIASHRRHTCIAPWRQYALDNPTVVHDGTHPSEWGVKAWVNIVRRAVNTCR